MYIYIYIKACKSLKLLYDKKKLNAWIAHRVNAVCVCTQTERWCPPTCPWPGPTAPPWRSRSSWRSWRIWPRRFSPTEPEPPQRDQQH